MFLRRITHAPSIVQKLYRVATGEAVIIDTPHLNALRTEASRPNPLQTMQPPVWIFGPPRSGSTFLAVSMNWHEKMFITNELRVMSFVNDLFRRFLKSSRMEWNLTSDLKGAFLTHFRSEMANLVKGFYYQYLPSPDAVWGDKHPHYADPALDPGALDTILELFPDSRFIHLYRNPRNQIYSYTKLGWKDFGYAVNAYKRIVRVGQQLGRRVGPARYMEVRYEDLCQNGEELALRICTFLNIPPSERWANYLREQSKNPTPLAQPVTATQDLGKPKEVSFSAEEERYLKERLGGLMQALGYSSNGDSRTA